MVAKQVFAGAVDAMLFCAAVLMLGVVARHAYADGPGGSPLCVPVAPGQCDRDCCNRCIYREGIEFPDGYLCTGRCKWLEPECIGCEPACDENFATDTDGSRYCPCLEL